MSLPLPEILELKRVLEENFCIDHVKRPTIEVFDNRMKITCCCGDFYNECRAIAVELNGLLEIKDLIIE